MELLTVQEAAQAMRVSQITVRRQIAAGRLQAVRAGRQIRVPRWALDAFLAPAQRAEAQTENRSRRFPPPTAEELAQRRVAIDELLGLRELMPRIAPLTTRDLILQARREEGASYDPGEPPP